MDAGSNTRRRLEERGARKHNHIQVSFQGKAEYQSIAFQQDHGGFHLAPLKVVKSGCHHVLDGIAGSVARPFVGGKDGSVVCEKILEGEGHYGYNASTDKYEDLVVAGVIDPTKVTRTALQNAASVATLLLTSDAVIAEKPERNGHKGNGYGGADMY